MKSKYQLISCLVLVLFSHLARSNPTDGVVSAGEAAINVMGDKLEVVQQSSKAIIDWQSFNIAPHEHTNFNQPSSEAVVLNRIHSQEASNIAGTLTANGKVVLINQNGLMFTKDAKVDVSGLLATTANISNTDFMQVDRLEKIGLKFNLPGKPDSKIINNGEINAKGLIGLVAPQVINTGVIVAKAGKVELSSGEVFTLDLYGDNLLSLGLSKQQQEQLVFNSGEIIADGGKILLTAAAGKELVKSFIVNTGLLQAKSISSKNGQIILMAEGSNAVKHNLSSNKGTKQGESKVVVKGLVDVSGTNLWERGGKVIITGDEVGILNGTIINASGYRGLAGTTVKTEPAAKRLGSAGGEILIGGDYLGQGKIPTAKKLHVDPEVIIINDAIDYGDAGRTVFWSDEETNFYGQVFSRALGGKECDREHGYAVAGGNLGDGGFVETSSKKKLGAYGYVDLTASNGRVGTYLLDPTDIEIYGNVTPKFVSTDGSVNLNSNLIAWMDALDNSTVMYHYGSSGSFQNRFATITSAVQGNNTLSYMITNAGFSASIGGKIRLKTPSLEYLVNVDQSTDPTSEIYTINSINGYDLGVTPNLNKNYAVGQVMLLGTVSRIKNKSSNSLYAANFTGAYRGNSPYVNAVNPVLAQNSFNQLPSINIWSSTIGNVHNGLNVPNFLGDENSYSYFVAAKGDGTLMEFGVSGGGRVQFDIGAKPILGSYHPGLGIDNALVYPNNITNSVPHVYEILCSKNLINLYMDGALQNTSTTGILVPSDLTGTRYHWLGYNVGSYYRFGGVVYYYNYFSGHVPEVLVFKSFLNTKERNLVEQYQTTKWGITPNAAVTNNNSIFTTRYLENLAKTTDLILSGENIKLDLQGDTLTLNNNSNLMIDASNTINAYSLGTIVTNRSTTGGDINIVITGNATSNIAQLNLIANNGGAVDISSEGNLILGKITAGSIAVTTNGSNSNIVIPQDVTLITTNPNNAVSLSAGGMVVNDTTSSLDYVIETPGSTAGVIVDPASAISGTLSRANAATQNAVGTYSIVQNTLSAGTNYTINYIGGQLTILPKTLRIAAAPNQQKVYGSADPVLIYVPTLSDFAYSDTSSIITGGVSRVLGDSVGSYAINNAGLQANNYTISYTGDNFVITPKTLRIAAAPNQGKVYGSADPSLTYVPTLSDFAYSDTSSIITGGVVRVPGDIVGSYAITNAGLQANNYSISYTGADFTITPKPINAVVASVTKTYDRTTTINLNAVDPGSSVAPAANISTINANLSGVVANDNVVIDYSNVSGNYNDYNAGNNKPITLTGLQLAGTAKLNYALPININANVGIILPKVINVELNPISKTYDQNLNLIPVTSKDYKPLTGIIGSDQVYLNKSATLGTVVMPEGVATRDIVARAPSTQLIGTGLDVLLTDFFLVGASKNNYILNYSNPVLKQVRVPGVASILPRTLKTSLQGNINKIYDGTNNATLVVKSTGNDQYKNISGVIGSDVVQLKKSTLGTYNSKNVLEANQVTVTNLELQGKNKDSYQLESTTLTLRDTKTSNPAYDNHVTIAPKVLGLALNNLTKEYDGSSSISLGDYSLSGVVGQDDVYLLNKPTTGTLVNPKSIGSNSNIIVQGLELAGADKANYSIPTTLTVKGTIAPKAITVNLKNDITKRYDGNTKMILNNNNYEIIGDIDSQDKVTISLPTVGAFLDKNVGANKMLRVAGVQPVAAVATNAKKYSVNNNNTLLAQAVASITPANLQLNIASKQKTYGNKDPGLTYVAQGLVGGDSLKLARAPGEDAGTYPIEVAASSLATLANYYVSQLNLTPILTINKADLTITANNKTKKFGTVNPIFDFSAKVLVDNKLTLFNPAQNQQIKDAAAIQLSCAANNTTAKGKYSIIINGASATNNYNIKYTNGTLTIQ